jgi:hypothetical protein
MTVSNGQNQRIAGATIGPNTKLTVTVATVAATVTLDSKSSTLQSISSAGARNVVLPALERGLTYFIMSAGAGLLTVQDPALATVGTVAAGKMGIFSCDGLAWRGGSLS